MSVLDRVFEPWPDDEQCPENIEYWGWWDETPYRVSVDGENCRGNVPTPIFEIMWKRNPANRRNADNGIGSFDPDEPGSDCRWILWDEIDIAIEEMKIALAIATERGLLN